MDAAAREQMGERTLALAEDIFTLADPHLDAIMRVLMLRVGRVIARNLDEPAGEGRVQ
ncbi:hypothetical protein [Methylobacterium sp. Leaf87]|uniref:hypothetical protein n=1 Tax=Methylobacterium sp. Leaf87 TaxID=1736243 RepID=UPI0012E7D463|nr:hypothetical protein [Methylobacterium sp. Leaf87]